MAGGNLRCDMDNALGTGIGVLLFNPERMEVPAAKGERLWLVGGWCRSLEECPRLYKSSDLFLLNFRKYNSFPRICLVRRIENLSLIRS
jgi:hypothetical protein